MIDPVLAAARRGPFSREPRFYPPGQHPAAVPLREQVRALESLPPSSARNEALSYALDRIAAFEEGETDAKYLYLRKFRR